MGRLFLGGGDADMEFGKGVINIYFYVEGLTKFGKCGII
jgi:hypothetical protein